MKLAFEMAVKDMGGEISAVTAGEDRSIFHGMLRLRAKLRISAKNPASPWRK